jgi:hypothetical protein
MRSALSQFIQTLLMYRTLGLRQPLTYKQFFARSGVDLSRLIPRILLNNIVETY